MIDISKARELDEDTFAGLEALVRECDLADGTRGEVGRDKSLNYHRDMASWFVAREGAPGAAPGAVSGAILGFASVFAPESETAELSALVRPSARRRGIFTGLFAAARGELAAFGYRDLLLVRDAASAAGGALIAGWGSRRGAAIDHREFAMLLGEAGRAPRAPAGDPGVSLFRAEQADLPALAAMAASEFGGSAEESLRFLEATAANPERSLLAARASPGGPVLGMVSVHVDGERASINALVVDPAARRRGLGSRLLDEAAALALGKGAREVGLEVDALNRGALGIYLRRGFEVVSEVEYWRMPLPQS